MNISHCKDSYILFIDSGLGGLSTLSKTFFLKPANYIYFADNKFAPYGTKSDAELKDRLHSIISNFDKKYNLISIVLACNTATTSSIEFLRKTHPHLNIIGTEPAFKVARDKNFKSPAILATPCTISHLSQKNLKDFHLIPESTLATCVENFYLTNSPKDKMNLLRKLYQIKESAKNNDCLILGCTHYSLIKEKFCKILKIPIIDGNDGVARQVFKTFNKSQQKLSSIKIILSLNNSNCLQKYKKILRQILAKQINL